MKKSCGWILSVTICFLMLFSIAFHQFPMTTTAAADQATGSPFWIEFIDVGQGDAALVQCNVIIC